MRAVCFSLLLCIVFLIGPVSSETITIQDCDDVTLGNSAYANDGWIEKYEKSNSDKLVIDLWRC